MANPFGPDWITTREARQFAYNEGGQYPATAGDAILAYCRIGHIQGRALHIEWTTRTRYGDEETESAMHCPVPMWFWENCTEKDSSAQDWLAGVFTGKGVVNGESVIATITGLHLYRPALNIFTDQPDNDGPKAQPKLIDPAKGGSPPIAWWDELWVEICRQIYLAELIPNRQADITRAMHNFAAARGYDVGDTAIRERSSKLWRAIGDAARN